MSLMKECRQLVTYIFFFHSYAVFESFSVREHLMPFAKCSVGTAASCIWNERTPCLYWFAK